MVSETPSRLQKKRVTGLGSGEEDLRLHPALGEQRLPQPRLELGHLLPGRGRRGERSRSQRHCKFADTENM